MPIGQLARTSGLTVRALHHYERIGLLTTAQRTTAGHRLYDHDQVSRLYRLLRLRQLGMPLGKIRSALDNPHSSLPAELESHLAALEGQLATLSILRHRVLNALNHLRKPNPSQPDLMEVLSAMEAVDSSIRRRISIMVYRDPGKAHQFLTEVFGLTPGDITFGPDGRATHAEVSAGDGVIWLHSESPTYQLASPASLGASTATMAVLVDDVDEHHHMVEQHGADIVYQPVDQPYGYREYSVRDCEGSLWSFMKELPQEGRAPTRER